MELLITEKIDSLNLDSSLAIIVAFRAGKMINQIDVINFDTFISEFAMEVVKEKITDKLGMLLRVHRDIYLNGSNLPRTSNLNLPTRSNLQGICQDLLFRNESIQYLNQMYTDLGDQTIQSEYFLQLLNYINAGTGLPGQG